MDYGTSFDCTFCLCSLGCASPSVSVLHWKRNRTSDREKAAAILRSLQKKRFVRVSNVTTKEKRKYRPLALNTVQLLRLASSQLKMSPDQAMKAAEELYMEGFISYPRTGKNQSNKKTKNPGLFFTKFPIKHISWLFFSRSSTSLSNRSINQSQQIIDFSIESIDQSINQSQQIIDFSIDSINQSIIADHWIPYWFNQSINHSRSLTSLLIQSINQS